MTRCRQARNTAGRALGFLVADRPAMRRPVLEIRPYHPFIPPADLSAAVTAGAAVPAVDRRNSRKPEQADGIGDDDCIPRMVPPDKAKFLEVPEVVCKLL